MTIEVGLRADEAILLQDKNEPRRGLVIPTIAEAERLIDQLTAVISYLHAEKERRRQAMRALMQGDEPT